VGWLKVAEVMFQWQVMNLEGHEKQHTSWKAEPLSASQDFALTNFADKRRSLSQYTIVRWQTEAPEFFL
jgi:hypothetical protein